MQTATIAMTTTVESNRCTMKVSMSETYSPGGPLVAP
jgi:hypothetical protein